MSILTVSGLCKRYPAFELRDLSFTLHPGEITGFIGRNGAGKSTTLKSLLHFVQPDAGTISFFDLPYEAHEQKIKQRLGFVAGGVDYYPTRPLRTISAVTRRFYPNWDDAAYRRLMALFQLDERKTPAQLSAGMRVKYALTMALSHHAELLLLDEPTSGLDPISRDEVLDLLLQLRREGVTILFSTHITSDLEQCADRILYLRAGQLAADATLEAFAAAYRLVEIPEGTPVPEGLIGCKPAKHGQTALIPTEQVGRLNLPTKPADLSAIMVHLEKEALQ